MTKIEKNGISFIEKAILKYENRYDYSLVNYSGYDKKVGIVCKLHGTFLQTPEMHLLSKDGCQKCANDTRAINLSLTKEDFIKRAIIQFGDKYDYTKVEYTGCEKKVQIGCKKHGVFEQTPSGHLRNGNGCKECTKEIAGKNKILSTEQFIEKAIKKHGNTYDYSKVIYTKAIEEVIIICKQHGEFKQKASGHLTGHGCHICGVNSSRDAKIKTTKQIVEQAKQIHGDKYNYDKVNYKDNLEKITIICDSHGEFKQTASNHLQGQGCPTCGKESTTIKQTKTSEQFIKDAIKTHGNRYNYDKVVYVNGTKKVIIGCGIHGDFKQAALSHTQGKGCQKCAAIRIKEFQEKTTEQFIEEAIKIHGDKYTYNKTLYIKNDEKVVISCKNHGDFEQTPKGHLKGRGCGRCNRFRRKTTEQFIEEAIVIHNNYYSYKEANYVSPNDKITITCPTHGNFEQKPWNHISGKGCQKCAWSKGMGYSRSQYINQANGRVCIFYTLRCFNNEEEFYKIGITMRSVKERYSPVKHMPYEYEVISEVKGSAGFIFDLERDEKRKLKALHCVPKIYFAGSKTECFTDYKI